MHNLYLVKGKGESFVKSLKERRIPKIKRAFEGMLETGGEKEFVKLYYDYVNEAYKLGGPGKVNMLSLFLEEFVFKYIRESDADKVKKYVTVFEELDIVDSITLHISQLNESLCFKEQLDEILEIVKGGNFYNLYILYFSRLNPEYIGKKYEIIPEMLNAKEIYLGISSGYFFIAKNKDRAVKRLFNLMKDDGYGLMAQKTYDKLILEGFKLQ